MGVVEFEADGRESGASLRRSSVGSGTRVRVKVGRYEVVGEIASGGMATVYLALLAGARGPQRFVALKVLHPHLAREPEFIAMFLDEARLASSIRDPHVVPIAEIGRTDDGFFLVMDYVEGDTLARFAARAATRGTRLPREVVVRILLDALAGLHAAHELTDDEGRSLGLVHRDVSPQNILVGTDGLARITDFGVARAAARLSSTRNGRLKGKLAYMAPEQARSEATDRRADVFAAGILLWEMLAGRRLFKAETEAATIMRVVAEPIPRLNSVAPDVPAPFDAVCAKALARNPDDRYQTARQMADALGAAAAEVASSSPLDLGVASPRDVAAYVQAVIGQEIAMQRDVVRSWLEQSEPDAAAPATGSTTARLPLHRPLGEIALADLPGDGITATTTVGEEAKPAVEAALREQAGALPDDAAESWRAGATPPPVVETPKRESSSVARPRLLLQPEGPRAPHPPPVRSLLVPPAAHPATPAAARRAPGPARPLPVRSSSDALPAPALGEPEPAAFDPADPNAAPASSSPDSAVASVDSPPPEQPEARPAIDPERRPLPPAYPDRGPSASPHRVVGVVAVLLLVAGAALAWLRDGPPEAQIGPSLPLHASPADVAAAPGPGGPPASAAPVAPPPTPSAQPAVARAVAPPKRGAHRLASPGASASAPLPVLTPALQPPPAPPTVPTGAGDDLANPYRR